MIHSIDADEFDRRISNWLISQKCFKGKGLAVDGKVLRGGGLKLLSAIVHNATGVACLPLPDRQAGTGRYAEIVFNSAF